MQKSMSPSDRYIKASRQGDRSGMVLAEKEARQALHRVHAQRGLIDPDIRLDSDTLSHLAVREREHEEKVS